VRLPGGYYGIAMIGSTGLCYKTIIKNNTFRQCIFALSLEDVDSLQAENNIINCDSVIQEGIRTYNCSYSMISGNRISATNLSYGGQDAIGIDEAGNNNYVTIANNFISMNCNPTSNATTCAGISTFNSYELYVYFNNINIGYKVYYYVYIAGFLTADNGNVYSLMNNNIVNKGYGVTIDEFPAAMCDYNNLYSTNSAARGLALYYDTGSSYYYTVSEYIAGTHQTHTISIDPLYASDSDLQATNDSLAHRGIAISGITTDIDGNIRPNPPTIGANEINLSKYIIAALSAPDTNCIYTPISISDSSKSVSCGTMNHWLWSFGDGDTSSAQNPSHTYATPGVFGIKLIVSSSGGCTDSFIKFIFVDSTCVWPGDANNNKLVEITDLLNIGIAFNDSGPARGAMNNTWKGQYCRNWGKTFLTGGDYKHADCNGDGVVDSSDLMAINIDWGDTHKKTGAPLGNPNNPPFYLQFTKSTYNPGDTVTANMILGDSGKTLSNAYGLAFGFNYNGSYIKNNTIQLNFISSWLGNPGKDVIYFVKNDAPTAQIAAAITRIDHKDVSGLGKIGTMTFITENNIGGKTVIFTPTTAKLISSLEANIPIYLGIDSFVANTQTGIISSNNNITGINIYPNPANTTLNIESIPNPIQSITIFDAMGRVVYNEVPFRGFRGSIFVGNLPAGIYMIKLGLDNGSYTAKFMKR